MLHILKWINNGWFIHTNFHRNRLSISSLLSKDKGFYRCYRRFTNKKIYKEGEKFNVNASGVKVTGSLVTDAILQTGNMAIGAGNEYALGALHSLSAKKMKPKDRLTKALEAAVCFSGAVIPPFNFAHCGR